MASPLRLTTAGGDAAELAWRQVLDEFGASDAALSRFRDDAELTRLNRTAGSGHAVAVGRRLERAIVAADRARRLTSGRFDPRVLVDLERLGERGASLEGQTGRDGDRATWRDEPIAHRRVRGRFTVDRPLDLGGIGKGLALRWSTERVERAGVRDFLLDAGGDLVVRGRPPEGGRWLVGIEDPADGSEPLAVIRPVDGAVATSSIRRRRWDRNGQTVHHLLDPSTGEPAWNGLLAVTVVGPDPAWAEIWAKALFLAGPRRIAGEARRRGFAAWWVATDGTIEMTPAARAVTIWVAAET